MGNSEGEKPTRSEKAASPPREQSSVHVYPDWAAVQAYYGSGALPPPYFNPAATSGHAVPPYMWAPPQMMAPYGSPYAMYPHGGMYGPSAAPICMQIPAPLSLETPTKSSGKDSGSGKVTKESDVHAASGNGNANAESAGDAAAGVRGQSLSTDCGTEGSCERSYDSSARVKTHPLLDERELKREKRKQSNRESARRSRLRKQAEMEELGKKVDNLNVENLALRSEINKLVEDSEKLRSENSSLMDKLKIMQGQSDEMDSERTENQETSHINTENLLSRVNNPVSNGVHEQSEEK
ncbi:G-box-binding factor 3-like isoform X4 [Chenopodium quinoa]|uniref:G-box-binding factor 3-like isoform X4 n=1 Tax=Chenopodium quinoa TaxID=63459 RepID=UPI000B797B34|nr:G-box-binding factor 3-like isoform X4 [Chenopodium quinoa]